MDQSNSGVPVLSIVSPVYRAEAIVGRLYAEIRDAVSPITESFEVLLVEDGSPDNSWAKMKELAQLDRRVKAVKLSRNYGQHYAITAGLDLARGEWVIVMDCDLQDMPSEIPRLMEKAKEGFDVVLARRQIRKDRFLKRIFSVFFYRLLQYLTGTKQDPAVANFGIYHRRVVDAICSMREQIRYFPTMVKWVGFKQAYLNVTHAPGERGSSSYNFRRLLALAIDILLANSEKPIRLIVKTGFFISTIAFLVGIVTLIQYFLGKINVAGYTSLLLSVWFLGGIIMMIMGVIGLYVGKTFQNVKNRPIYIIEEKRNFGEN